jgi:hypothetical protein
MKLASATRWGDTSDQPAVLRWVVKGEVVLAVGVLTILLAVGSMLVHEPARVRSLTLVNGSEFALDVRVSSREGDGWLPLGRIFREDDRTVRDVLDQGDVWTFAVSGQGIDGGQVTVRRAELEAAGWTFTIPPEVAEQLRSAGAPATPD